jgi:hypothetical protein
MKMNIRYRKRIAVCLLVLWASNIIVPSACYALTSGPAQPETSSFSPAGVNDMVDLFTGDFKYNIPLIDIDGYPLNLNYESGTGMDDEASWVGLGWNLNVGAVTRQVRGLPDDMAGDSLVTEHYTKPKVTVGGRLSLKGELLGKFIKGNEGPEKKYNKVRLQGSVSLGVFSDSYTGIGAEVGANAGISFGGRTDGALTTSLGLGVTSSTASGVDVSPYINLGIKNLIDGRTTTNSGLSASLGYNTRSGLKALTLGSSFSLTKKYGEGKKERSYQGSTGYSGSFITFNTEPITPTIQIPYRSRFASFSIDAGYSAQVYFLGGGGTGYKSVTEVANPKLNTPAYGFLYAERGKNQKNAAMDFIREKETTIIPELPNLALPVHTPDMFSYTSQGGSGQFRLYRGGSGAFFDNEAVNDDGNTTIGGDIGFGTTFHAGVTLFKQTGKTTTRKWVSDNLYLSRGDFQDATPLTPNAEHVYFKEVGEKTMEDADMSNKLYGTDALSVSITGKRANAAFLGKALSKLQKTTRERRGNMITFLTGEEASNGALDKMIRGYDFNEAGTFHPPANHTQVPNGLFSRVDNAGRKKHHISEITVTANTGKRMVYGLPVYNLKQTEYTYAIGRKGRDYGIATGTTNQVPLAMDNMGQINHHKGIDHYYQKQSQPAYATSYLLTGILSPDYIDKTNDGITDDDAGTAIKFNYSKVSGLYKWRTPYHNATLNRALLADPDDDKASIVYGEKELWYVNTIETKTKIIYFITEDRKDALGVTDFTGVNTDLNTRQRCLKEIRLYSKADTLRPIKVVKFEYSYELCRGVPNSADNQSGTTTDASNGGKLTLKRVYFQYGNSSKGINHPYQFEYNKQVNGQEVLYGDMLSDRWGTFKTSGENTFPLKNDEFPYTNQDAQGGSSVKQRADQNASLWLIKQVKLPTGGQINIGYESDDYAYVQNKRAMVMSPLAALVDKNGNELDSASVSYLKDARGFKLKIDSPPPAGADPTQWFKNTYLNGSEYVYSKLLVKLATSYSPSTPGTDDDFVSCYSQVSSVTVSGQYAKVFLKDRTEGGVTSNPVIFSAWQTLKNEYPRFAYPGFDRRAGDESAQSSVGKAVTAIFTAFSNLSELTQNFYQKASKKNFATQVHLRRSFVKLTKQDGFKLGGGTRVRKISISDDWQAMSGSNKNSTAIYGQFYEYTTTLNGVAISSGVAAYEPSIGNDENPLKQPVNYIQKIKGSIDNFFDLERPFGESFFPAPTVGYSKVTVTDLNKEGDPDPQLRTGYTVSEFYTAKDFPVLVEEGDIQTNHNKPVNYLSVVGATSIDELSMSQGYRVDINDMHGKAKAVRTFNGSRAEIASTVFYYNADTQGADEFRLRNKVDIVQPDGTIAYNQVVGRDIEFFTDFRESESKNMGQSVNAGSDMVGLPWLGILLPHFPIYDNSQYKLFRSAVGVKVSTYYGILDKVVKTQNGSSVTTQNLAFDGLTGDAVVTRTQNEFNKYIYSLSLPAYWVYPGMGAAYKNLGIAFKNFSTNAAGETTNYASYLKAGDELMDVVSGIRFWVIDNQANPALNYTTKKLINAKGQIIANYNAVGLVKLVRSGFRNMLGAATASIVSLNNPMGVGRLKITSSDDMTGLGVINASVSTFNEVWPMAQANNPSDSTRVENTSAIFTFTYIPSNGDYGTNGAKLLDPTGTRIVQNSYLKGGLNRSGIWLNPPNTAYPEEAIGFETPIYIAVAGDYCIGYSGDDDFAYSLDNVQLPTGSYANWIVQPRYLTQGTHYLTAQCINRGTGTFAENPAGIGIEIYKNTLSQLEAVPADGTGANRIFSTRNLINSADLQSFRTINGNHVNRFTYRRFTNPYLGEYLGNWRERNSKVFQYSRYTSSTADKGMDVKSGGYFNGFSSYWFYGDPAKGETPGWQTNSNGLRPRWVTANTITSYDKYGQQLENKDALNRFSAAKFIFNGELPSAVASNAMNREIYSGSFEDKFFAPGTVAADSVKAFEFVQPLTGNSIRPFVTDAASHSGNYSVLLPAGGMALNTVIHSKSLGIDTLLSVNEFGEYNTKNATGLYPKGFEPNPSKTYIFNAWVKDTHPNDRSVNATLEVNGANIQLVCKAVVEDWKLLEGTITTAALSSANGLTILVKPSDASVYIDDIRIHPFDSHMKTYVYDDKTMRLMAEIDENGFATFYEYDDEGLLIRVKKETERGIMTIKETRSSYRKQGS